MLTIGRTLHLPWLALSLCSWSLFYSLLRRLEPQRKAEWHCRVVTIVHASLISLLSAWATLVQGPWPFTDAGGPNTPLQVVIVTVCQGYFLFDFSWCLYFQTEGFPMLLHHFLSIFGMFFMLVTGRHGTEMVATIFGSELTNPLLQTRWFLKETGRYKTLVGEVVDFLFMTSFFTIRIVVGSVLLVCYFQQPTTDIWGRLGAIGIYLIGWMFWVSIFQYAIYKYGKKYRAWRGTGKSLPPETSALVQQAPLDGDDEDERSESLGNGPSDGGDDDNDGGVISEQLSSRVDSLQAWRGKDLLMSSTSACQNGVYHRNNGKPSGETTLSGLSSGKDVGQR
ncbi:TLC domain-containing protein 5-like [Babylonia areolata]|uniref:TLC domain-containing protein 5-like n=1 Tax=Babylonia areolata TaxID=304850 RepID=UPI003FD583F7